MSTNHNDPNVGTHRDLNELKFLIFFECPNCGKFLNYAENCYKEENDRVLFCRCGWEKKAPLPSRFVNYDPSSGGFTTKWGETKKTRSIRLTHEAWNNLENVAKELGVNRADLIECWSRSITSDEMTQYALNEQLEQMVPGRSDAVLGKKHDSLRQNIGPGGWYNNPQNSALPSANALKNEQP